MKKISLVIFFFLLSLVFNYTNGYDVAYNHTNIKYTSNGLQIYGNQAKDFLAKGFSGQVDYIKNYTNGLNIKFVLSQKGNYFGSDKNDYFYGFDNYRTNSLIGGKGDDFYSTQHTFPIVEKYLEGVDTYFTSGNTGPGKEYVENIISSGTGGRIYGGNQDNLIITEGKGSEIHGGLGNDVFIVNGLNDSFFGEGGIDTIIFPGPINDYVLNGDDRGVNIKNIKTGGNFRVGNHDVEQFQFDDAFFGYEAGENTLSVGPNKSFKKVSDAIHFAGNGDIIEVESGVYQDDFAIINKNITILGKNGKAHFYAKSPSFKGKANFIISNSNVVFDNVEFSGNKVNDKNGAGIRFEGGILTVKNSYFHNNEVAILGGNYSTGIVNIENSEFGYNGANSGITHTLNLGIIKELNVTNSFFHNSKNGHNIRTSADNLNISNSFFYDGLANTSFNIEVAKSINTNISGNTFVQTESGENTNMILNNATVSSNFSGNTFINNSSKGVNAIQNNSLLPIALNNNVLYNYKGYIGGNSNFTGSNNTIVDKISINIPLSNVSVGNIDYKNPIIETIISKDESEFVNVAKLTDFAGKNITVGTGKDYKTLNEAIINAKNGDKIYIDEGVYTSDYSIISSKNIAIIGLGKGAELKKVSVIPNGKAIIVSNKSNIYLENLIFSDSQVPDKNGAGIRYEGGTMTIENCTFKNNENAILGGATVVGKGKIWINNSKFYDNGKNGTGYTHAIYIGEMDYFDIKNSTIKGTFVGHHIKSRARNNVIENNLIDDDGKNASYNIDLPNGGNGLIKGNTIIQSIKSTNRTMVSYCAEKNPPNSGELLIENNIFKSEGSVSIGIKNFYNNKVILTNNTFNNVSTKYIGNNIIEK